MLARTWHVSLFLAGVAFCFACKPADPVPDSVSIGYNETVYLHNEVRIQADSLWDSRCPEDWNCLVAGYTGARLLLTRGSKSIAVYLTDLPLYEPGKGYIRQDSAVVGLQGQRLTIILRDIVPHRKGWTSYTSDQKAILQISGQ